MREGKRGGDRLGGVKDIECERERDGGRGERSTVCVCDVSLCLQDQISVARERRRFMSF